MSKSLDNKRILVVDDEPDVLETIAEVLEMCHIETAADFQKAEQLLKTRSYDMVILDIMGVRGLHLIDVAVQRDVLPVMLTAPAFNPGTSSNLGNGELSPASPRKTLPSWTLCSVNSTRS